MVDWFIDLQNTQFPSSILGPDPLSSGTLSPETTPTDTYDYRSLLYYKLMEEEKQHAYFMGYSAWILDATQRCTSVTLRTHSGVMERQQEGEIRRNLVCVSDMLLSM